MEHIFACQGKKEDGTRCLELFVGKKPAKCQVCGSTDIKQGIENLTFDQKNQLMSIRRSEANNKVKKEHGMFSSKPKPSR
jgi:hypothetical protein